MIFCTEKVLVNGYVFVPISGFFPHRHLHHREDMYIYCIIGTVIKQCLQVLAVAIKNSISHLVGILNLCLVIKKIDLCCLIVKEMAKVSYHITLPRILSTQVFSLSYIILIVWRPLREGREIWTFSNQNAAYCDKNHLSMALYTLQIPNSYYEKKKTLKQARIYLFCVKLYLSQ